MTGKSTPVVFITANVGSIFEEPTRMIKTWTEEFLSTISRLEPKFLALHCQEVGGKNYEKSMQYVDKFVKLLLASDELRLFDKVRIYLDEDYTSAEKFTALGNLYFIHESLTDVAQYDFASRSFVEVAGTKVFSHDVEDESTKEKSKFPLEYFPECKWSRKGFLRTRWSINGTVLDLVNIHLFHDASNFVAIEAFPSEYSETRRHALIYTLDRFHNDEHLTVPVCIFGDFNFRTDTKAVVSRLAEGLERTLTEEGTEDSTVDFFNHNGKVLCVGKKTFSHWKHHDVFSGGDSDWLRSYDKELEFFRDQLFEFGISFQPSYPFEEGETGDKEYMHTRCPAWCDRVLLTKDALSLVKQGSDAASVEYGLMGRSTCMGDHKPVYLKIELKVPVAKPSEVTWRRDVAHGPTPIVKRVNSASVVETRDRSDRRHDWQTARCNSDVSWNPNMTAPSASRKSLLHGNSRIRLVSPTDSIEHSLPRLTSHHSSSDEEWFEVIDGDDDVLTMSSEKTKVEVPREVLEACNESKDENETQLENSSTQAKDHTSISILKRLSKDEVIEQEGAAGKVVNDRARVSHEKKSIAFKTRSLLANMKRKTNPRKEDDAMSWESIDLSDPASKQEEKIKSRASTSCCTIQ